MIRAFLALVGLMCAGYGGFFLYVVKINHMEYHPAQLKLYASFILGMMLLAVWLLLYGLHKLSTSNDRRLDAIERQSIRR
jgi:high-affinity Fe2+/Pb2+ permease